MRNLSGSGHVRFPNGQNASATAIAPEREQHVGPGSKVKSKDSKAYESDEQAAKVVDIFDDNDDDNDFEDDDEKFVSFHHVIDDGAESCLQAFSSTPQRVFRQRKRARNNSLGDCCDKFRHQMVAKDTL